MTREIKYKMRWAQLQIKILWIKFKQKMILLFIRFLYGKQGLDSAKEYLAQEDLKNNS